MCYACVRVYVHYCAHTPGGANQFRGRKEVAAQSAGRGHTLQVYVYTLHVHVYTLHVHVYTLHVHVYTLHVHAYILHVYTHADTNI